MDYDHLLPTFGPNAGRQIHAAWIGAFGREPRAIILDVCEDAPGFEIEGIALYRMGNRWAVGVPRAHRSTRDEMPDWDTDLDSEHECLHDALLRVVELIARRDAFHALSADFLTDEFGDMPF